MNDHDRRLENRRRAAGRAVIDGLLVGRQELWSVVARDVCDHADPLRELAGHGVGGALRICRRVLPDGTLVIGDTDPERDLWLSDLIRWGDRGQR